MSSAMDNRPAAAETPSIGDQLANISADLSTLMRQEVALAKAELRQSGTRAGKGAGLLAGAGVGAHLVLVFVSVALWWGLGDSIGHGWSALVVAVIWAVVAGVLALTGKKQLARIKGLPRTADTVKKIPSAAAGHEGGR